MSDPLVSVVMGVRDGAEHLPACLDSLTRQSLAEWELIAVDDGSTDATAAILAEHADREPRLKVLTNPENLGLTKSLNRALAVARGAYIARQDADDVSRPTRLARQVAFLEQNRTVDIVGCWVEGGGDPVAPTTLWRTPSSPAEVRYELLFGNCIAHPSVMLRRRLIEDGPLYDESVRYAQDFALWHRLAPRHDIANMPEPLYFRRHHAGQVGVQHGSAQADAVQAVLVRRYAALLGDEAAGVVPAVRRLERGEALGANEVHELARLLPRLWRAFMAEQGSLPAGDIAMLRRRQARRLLRLAARGGRRAPLAGVGVALRALAYDPLAAWRVLADRSA